MSKLFAIIIYFVFSFIFIHACNLNKSQERKAIATSKHLLLKSIDQSHWFGKKIDKISLDALKTEEYKLNQDTSKYRILYYFNGDCSSCVAEFINWLATWQKKSNIETSICYFVSSSIDVELIKYYLDETNIELPNGIYNDPDSTIIKCNEFMKNINLNTYIFLINDVNEIVAFGNPFAFDNVKNIYIKHDVL